MMRVYSKLISKLVTPEQKNLRFENAQGSLGIGIDNTNVLVKIIVGVSLGFIAITRKQTTVFKF